MTGTTKMEVRNDATGYLTTTGRIDGRPTRRTTGRPFRLRQYEESEYQHQTALIKCLQRFKHPDALFFAVPNQSDGGAQRGYFLRKMGVRAGVSDLVFLFRGQILFLELKRRGGEQSPAQHEFETQVKTARGEYYVSRSLTESLDLLYARGIITRDLAKT